MKKINTKLNTKINRQHTKKRLLERYNLICNNDEIKQITNIIIKGKSTPLHSISSNVDIHKIPFKNRNIIALFHKKCKEIITVNPEIQSMNRMRIK